MSIQNTRVKYNANTHINSKPIRINNPTQPQH